MPRQLVGTPMSPLAAHMGLARVDVTPPVGIYARNWGAARHDVAETVHRPITLAALTLAEHAAAPPLVLVEADLGFWTTLPRFHALRGRVLSELQLDSPRFLFAMTHTHASAHLAEPMPDWPGGEILRAWLDDLEQATIDVVRKALAAAAPSLLEWHYGRCQLAAQRDLPDPQAGAGRYLCGYNPDQPADDTLLVGRITDQQGRLRAALVNYACHPTTLGWDNRALSPDFIGAMRETIGQATGGEAIFLQGASGELAPRLQYVDDPAVADRHGRQLGYAALATLEDMEPPGTQLAFAEVVESGAPLAVWRHQPVEPSNHLGAVESTVELALKPLPTADELDRQFRACADRALAERLRRKRNLRRVLGDGASYRLPVWAWQLGQAVLLGSPAEAYSCFQQELRRTFAGRHIACLNDLNGSIGYLPEAQLYDLDLYQAWQTPFERDSLQRYINASRELTRQFIGG